MWLTFAPIPQYTAVFYGISVDQVDWFSISYFVVSLLIGFLAIVILDIFGLRASVSREWVGPGLKGRGIMWTSLTWHGGDVGLLTLCLMDLVVLCLAVFRSCVQLVRVGVDPVSNGSCCAVFSCIQELCSTCQGRYCAG